MRLSSLPADLEALLVQFQTSLAAAYLTLCPANEPTLWTVPKVSYVAPGTNVPWDGESLTIYTGSIGQGFAGRPAEQAVRTVDMLTFNATWWVQILRVVRVQTGEGFDPNDLVPSASDIDRDGQQTMADISALVQAAIDVKATYYDPQGGEFSIGPMTFLGPDGGLAAVRQAIHVNLD